MHAGTMRHILSIWDMKKAWHILRFPFFLQNEDNFDYAFEMDDLLWTSDINH